MRRVILSVVLLVGALVGFWPGHDHSHAVPPAAHAQTDYTCSQTPLGALPPSIPTWCSPIASGPTTFVNGANSWLDEFNHGLTNASLGSGYRVFTSADAGQDDKLVRQAHFRHADHWMVDIQGRDRDGGPPWNYGGATMRPDRSFRFENGRLVVEADVAAGISQYAGSAWPELTVTTAPAPTGVIDDLYAYGIFRGQWTFGCRLEDQRGINCALWDNTGRVDDAGGRRYELPLRGYQGMTIYEASDAVRNGAWRRCVGTDPDLNCRDRFRLELERTAWRLFVNGTRIYEASNIPQDRQLPDAMVNGDVYVYFASWIAKPNADTVRFHWDRLAVNPGSNGGPSPMPTATPVPPTPTPQGVCERVMLWNGQQISRTTVAPSECGR